jgi:hypothetical protein
VGAIDPNRNFSFVIIYIVGAITKILSSGRTRRGNGQRDHCESQSARVEKIPGMRAGSLALSLLPFAVCPLPFVRLPFVFSSCQDKKDSNPESTERRSRKHLVAQGQASCLPSSSASPTSGHPRGVPYHGRRDIAAEPNRRTVALLNGSIRSVLVKSIIYLLATGRPPNVKF